MATKGSSSSTAMVRNGGNDLCTDGVGEDRISNLPDEILGDILSSFGTQEAVRTSVLSKRWRYVWTSVPSIEIVVNHSDRFATLEIKERLKDFVDRVLHLNTVYCLRKMALLCPELYHGCFSEWIRALSIRDIDELYLGCPGTPDVELPHFLFMCKKLVILETYTHYVLNVPTVVCLPRLKTLILHSVQFFDENSMKNLLASCPVLEVLDIGWELRDTTKATMTLYIQSSSLKSLRLTTHFYNSPGTKNIIIDAANLERLHVTGDSGLQRFDVHSNLSSLVSVGIDLHKSSPKLEIELLRKMISTKYLYLSFGTIQSLNSVTLTDLPMFPYLTDLVVEIMEDGWSVLSHLLQCSPNLITLELNQKCEHGLDEEAFGTLICSMLHLKSVHMRRFDWSQNEMDMVKYFLKYAPVLKKMSIYLNPLSSEDSDLCKEMFMFPKDSTACELELFSYDFSTADYIPLSSRYLD